MADDITIPKVGPVNKYAVGGVVLVGAGFVGWRWWQARQAASVAAAAATSTDTTDDSASGTDDGTDVLPSVDGGDVLDEGGGYGDPGTVDSYGFQGLTNAEWTQYAANQLQQSDTWAYSDIVTALGNYLSGVALTTTQQQIVSAAIAVAGYPPVAPSQTSPVVGTTAALTAPTGLSASGITQTTANISWSAVSGAAGYHMYVNGSPDGDSEGTTGTIKALTAGTSYTVSVAAYDVTGTAGPISSPLTVKTTATPAPAAAPKTPANLRLTGINPTGATIGWNTSVGGAYQYHVYLNGKVVGTVFGTFLQIPGLKPNTKYGPYTVKAANAAGALSAASNPLTFTTSK
jgi:hypothetical protein